MDKLYYNQDINCTVKNCAYYDEADNKCKLASIKVSGFLSKKKKDTFCASFQEKS